MVGSAASCDGSIFGTSLSYVKLILSYLRASVSQDRLCDQLSMRIKREEIKTTHFGDIIEDVALLTSWKMLL